MKKLFTIDDIAVAFVSALGYGFGATISKLSGWPEPLCMAASFVLGLVVESIVSKIANKSDHNLCHDFSHFSDCPIYIGFTPWRFNDR